MKAMPVRLAVTACLCLHTLAAAQTVTFTLDPERSSVALSGSIAGFAASQQAPGSLTARYEGTLNTLLTANMIEFTGGSLVAARNSGAWAPKAEGQAGTEPACYGATASAFLTTAQAAARQVVLDITSLPIALVAGEFDSQPLAFSFAPGSSARVDYRVTGLLSENGSEPLAGIATNAVATASRLETVGNVQTLTLPIDAEFTLTLLNPDDSRLKFAGQLVATRLLTPAGPTFDQWLEQQFPGIDDPAQIGPGADPDGDNIPNLVEFAFGLSPMAIDPDFAPLKGAVPAPENWVLEFVRPAGLGGIAYVVQGSDNLQDWTDLSATPTISPLEGGQERITFTLAVDPSAVTHRFVRLIVRPI